MAKALQKTQQNKLVKVEAGFPDTIELWIKAYFQFEVSSSDDSRKELRRDLRRFHGFMIDECGNDKRDMWTRRLSGDYIKFLKNGNHGKKNRGYGDRTVNRNLAHLKTFSKWIHKIKPFPLGDPMKKISLIPVRAGLEVERAILPQERRRLLDAADMLPIAGGRSKDRNRYKGKKRPQRKGFRPWRNRAIVYTLTETGMRRTGATRIDLDDLDLKNHRVTVREKGGRSHTYKITADALSAIEDYLQKERPGDNEVWQSPALFQTACN